LNHTDPVKGYDEFHEWHEEGNVYFVLKEMGYSEPIPEVGYGKVFIKLVGS